MANCTNMRYIINKNYEKYGGQRIYYVACGTCLNCMKRKAKEWEREAITEWQKHKYNAFVTLTYDDEAIEHLAIKMSDGTKGYSLSYRDFQLFMKRLRMNLKRLNPIGYEKDFKYLVAGEYGDEYNRPHLHILFFGLDFGLIKLFELSWQYGIIDSKPLKSGAIPYVCKYMTKGLNSKKLRELYDENNMERPFIKHSIRMGAEMYYNNEKEIREKKTLKWDNTEIPIRRYYANKMKLFTPKEKLRAQNERMLKDRMIKPKDNERFTDEELRKWNNLIGKEVEANYRENMRAKGIPMEDGNNTLTLPNYY